MRDATGRPPARTLPDGTRVVYGSTAEVWIWPDRSRVEKRVCNGALGPDLVGCFARGVRALRRLAAAAADPGAWPAAPGLLAVDPPTLTLTLPYAGEPVTAATWPDDGAAQCARLAATLADARVHHNDIKPSELLVDGAGRLWLIDFGWATFGAERPPLDWPATLGERWRAGHVQRRADTWHFDDAVSLAAIAQEFDAAPPGGAHAG